MRSRHPFLFMALLGAAFGQAGAQPASTPQTGRGIPPSFATPVVGETMVYRGTVRAVDPATRVVVLEGADGGTSTMRVGEQIRNLENLRPGDRVTVRYTEAVAHSIVEGADSGIRQRIEADAVRQAVPGGKPGLQAVARMTVVASVVDVDRDRGRVTLRGTEREPVQVRVPDPAMLRDLDRGDQVVVTYAQSAAVSIEPGTTSANR